MGTTGDEVLEAVRMTFEQMAFLDVAPGLAADGIPPARVGPVLFLAYTWPKTGSFVLFLPKTIRFLVAEGIYSQSWDSLTPGQLDDSLLELMNVLAGRLLTQRFGSKTTYSMGLPTVLFDPPEGVPGREHQDFEYHVDQSGFILVWNEAAE